MKHQNEKWKVDLFWNGYCPECWLKGKKARMKLNSDDFFECEESGLQIVITFPNFFVSILKFRGKGEWRSKPDYAHDFPRNDMLCYPITDNVPNFDSKLKIDYEQFISSEEIENYIKTQIK